MDRRITVLTLLQRNFIWIVLGEEEWYREINLIIVKIIDLFYFSLVASNLPFKALDTSQLLEEKQKRRRLNNNMSTFSLDRSTSEHAWSGPRQPRYSFVNCTRLPSIFVLTRDLRRETLGPRLIKRDHMKNLVNYLYSILTRSVYPDSRNIF